MFYFVWFCTGLPTREHLAVEGTSSKTMNETSKGKLVGVPGAGPLTHPRTWQQLWLDRRRETLMKRLQGHAMAIADRLIREGHMDPSLDEAYLLIVSQHTVPAEKVRHLIDFLRRKPPETFDHFQSALDEFGCGELSASDEDVRELEAELNSLPSFERLSSCFPASVETARELLKSSYLKAAESIHVLEGISRNKEGGLKDLDEIFVNIGLVSSDEVERLCSEWTGKDGGVEAVLANALAARQVSLCDLWRVGQEGKKEPDKILALGTAGSGKTLAFTMKASYEWCGGKFWEQMALLRTIRCRGQERVACWDRLPAVQTSRAWIERRRGERRGSIHHQTSWTGCPCVRWFGRRKRGQEGHVPLACSFRRMPARSSNHRDIATVRRRNRSVTRRRNRPPSSAVWLHQKECAGVCGQVSRRRRRRKDAVTAIQEQFDLIAYAHAIFRVADLRRVQGGRPASTAKE